MQSDAAVQADVTEPWPLAAQNGEVEIAKEAWAFFKDKRIEPGP